MSYLANSEDQMKCCIMQYFIKVYTICYGKIDLQTENTILFYNNRTPLGIYTMDHPKFIVSNQNEEPISLQGLTGLHGVLYISFHGTREELA